MVISYQNYHEAIAMIMRVRKVMFNLYINNEGKLIKRAFISKLQGNRNIDIVTKLQIARMDIKHKKIMIE